MAPTETAPLAERTRARPAPPAATLRIGLVSHLAFGALTGGARGHVGGVEHQTSMLARWLAARGHDVSLITWDEGQADGARIEGVRTLKLCRADAGVPGLRFFHPRWTSLAAALSRADADVYYQNCGESATGQVALHAKRRGRRFVYSVASDPDCDPRLPTMTRRERLLYTYGLKAADRVIVQTRHQQRLLEAGFRRSSVVLPMPCVGPAPRTLAARVLPAGRERRVIWIGRLAEVKRPDRLLDVAGACPELAFDLVGPTDDSAYSRAVAERARGLRNVTYHGRADRARLEQLYPASHALLCTSEYEGLPNVFLEAWGHGVPVVSTVDPDGLLTERGLGTRTDPDQLATALRALLASPRAWAQASANARGHYLQNHDLEAAMPRFEEVFLEVARGA